MSLDEKTRLMSGNYWGIFGLTVPLPYIFYIGSFTFNTALILCGIPFLAILYFAIVKAGIDNKFGRFVFGAGAPIILMLGHLSLLKPTEAISPGYFVVQASCAIMSWMILNNKGEGPLQLTAMVTALASLGALLMFDGWASPEQDSSFYRNKVTDFSFLGIACGIYFTSYFLNKYTFGVVEEQREDLLKASEEKQRDLESQSGDLKKYIKQVEAQQKEDENRQRVTEGVDKLNKVLRTGDDWDSVKDGFISELVRQVNANQGVLYTVEERENEKWIELSACYAYDRKKYVEKRIEIGEGLVGQAYLEGDSIFRTEVPQNYMTIGSGLGDAKPRCLLIIPFRHEDSVIALAEIASFKPLNESDVKLVENIGDSVAAFLAGHRSSAHMKELVRKTEEANARMQEQEQTLRQNMEEMVVAQEDYERRIREYEKLLEENGVQQHAHE
ncbi:hypothetical protein FUAX_17460 [Fulvitalea axinellae]|uniref:GAF domain-containing protein n=1 Tax=Fulvitalea axinellae TaxID=1182444 RepID=A0AAU9CB42_9BACT|nr:hypothetical protein FUAX_17460 [Fulvitalea axinellae]